MASYDVNPEAVAHLRALVDTRQDALSDVTKAGYAFAAGDVRRVQRTD